MRRQIEELEVGDIVRITNNRGDTAIFLATERIKYAKQQFRMWKLSPEAGKVFVNSFILDCITKPTSFRVMLL